MRIEIIRTTPEHAATISSIGRIAFSDAFGYLFQNKSDLRDYLDYTYAVKKIAASLGKENNVYLLALADGRPAGFAKVKKHSLNEQLEAIAQSELQKLYVLKQYHGKGVGPALMDEVLQLVEDVQPDCLWLDTNVTNDRAIRFYEKYGFNKSGRHHFTIGGQTFKYYVMSMPVALCVTC